jgi:hypothetical protein
MKLESHVEKWASGVLAAVCLMLVIALSFQLGGVRAGVSRPATIDSNNHNRAQSASRRATDDLSRYDPVVRLDLLKELQSRSLHESRRDPFEFDLPKPPAPPPAPPVAVPPSPPPGPPPVPLAGMGFSEKAGGAREAYVSDGEEVYVVHEGETFAMRFKVLKITSTLIEIEDETTHQTVQLPFPQ